MVEGHDGDVRFRNESRNRAVSRMRIEKNMQYNPYLWSNRRNFRALQEIGVETMVNINDRKFFVLLEQG